MKLPKKLEIREGTFKHIADQMVVDKINEIVQYLREQESRLGTTETLPFPGAKASSTGSDENPESNRAA